MKACELLVKEDLLMRSKQKQSAERLAVLAFAQLRAERPENDARAHQKIA